MKGTRNVHIVALAVALPLCLSSCLAAVAAVGAGGVAYWQYSENEVVGEFPASFDATWEATVAELEAQGFGTPTESERGVTEGELGADGWDVRVELFTADRTRVRVRIGVFDTNDHERRSELLLEGIAERLGVAWTDPKAAEGEDAPEDGGSESEPDLQGPEAGPAPAAAES